MRQTLKTERDRILERDGYRCRYCGTDEGLLEVDHVVPRSLGGTNDPDNLVTACLPCNRRKHQQVWEPLPIFDDEIAAEVAAWDQLAEAI